MGVLKDRIKELEAENTELKAELAKLKTEQVAKIEEAKREAIAWDGVTSDDFSGGR